MGSHTIRNLDDWLNTRLRLPAASAGNSMEEEALVILRAALAAQAAVMREQNLADSARALSAPLGGLDLPELPRDPSRHRRALRTRAAGASANRRCLGSAAKPIQPSNYHDHRGRVALRARAAARRGAPCRSDRGSLVVSGGRSRRAGSAIRSGRGADPCRDRRGAQFVAFVPPLLAVIKNPEWRVAGHRS